MARNQAPAVPARQRLAVVIPGDVVERSKNAVYFTPGLTLAALVEEALLAALARLEKRNGGPFPQRASGLRPGRPMK